MTLPLVLAGVAFLFWSISQKTPPERLKLAERATAVRVIIANKQPVVPQARGYGHVKPARTWEAITQVGGTADYVHPELKKGTFLSKDTVLLRLSQVDFKLSIAQAKANIRAGEARLSEIDISADNYRATLAIEKETLALRQKELERSEDLFTRGTISLVKRDAARTTRLGQQLKVRTIENSLAILPDKKTVEIEQVAVQHAKLKSAQLDLARTVIRLPLAGRVAAVEVETGQYVRSGVTIAKMDGIEKAEIEARMSIIDMQSLLKTVSYHASVINIDPSAMTGVLRKMGLTATVRLHVGDEVLVWQGRVDRISETVDQKTGTLGVIVQVENAYSQASSKGKPPLSRGMFVEVVLQAPPLEGVLVPRNALRDGTIMLVDDQNRLKRVPVKTGLVRGETIMLREGISPGDRIVVSSPSPALEGMLLVPVSDEALMAELAKAGQQQ